MVSKSRKLTGATVAGLLAISLSACGAPPGASSSSASGSAQASGASSSVKACLVSDEGGFNDRSFNQSAKAGLDRAAKELGVATAQAESHAAADYKPNLDNMISQNCSLIIGVGFTINDAIRDAARANPNVKFAIIDARITENEKVVELPNAKPLVFNTAEAAYLAGYVSASMTQTGTVGTWGGLQIPSVSIFMDGYADGIARYNKDKSKDVKLVGWDKAAQNGSFAGSFNDTSKGKQLTSNMLAQGADIVMPVAGNTGTGGLAAIKEKPGSMAVWVDSDGYESTADGAIILTSVQKQIDKSVFDTISSVKDGKFSSEAYVGTLKNGGVGIAPFHDFDSKVSADVKSDVEKISKEIQDGTTKVETKNQP